MTLWEDQGTNITDTILGIDDNLTTTKESQDQLNGAVEEMDSNPMVQLQEALSNMATAMAPLLTVIADLVSKIATWVTENPKLTATITAIVGGIMIFLGVLAGLAPVIFTISSIMTGLATVFGLTAATVGWVVLAIAAAIAAIIAIIMNWGSIVEWLKGVWATVSTFFSELWEGIKQLFATTWEWISNFFTTTIPTIISNIASWFGELPGKIGNFLSQVIAKLTTWIAQMALKGGMAGKKLLDSVVNAVKSLPSKMAEAGRNVVTGFWDGIKNMGSWLASKVTNFFSGVVDGVKDLLGIHSPSRVFMGIGEYSGEGFADGLTAMTSDVSKAGQDLANASLPTKRNLPSFDYSYETANAVGQTNSQMSDLLGAVMQIVNSQQTPTQQQPIYLQVDGRTFAELTDKYFTDLNTKDMMRVQRGLA